MRFRVLLPLLGTILFLFAAELALEVRAYSRGWNTMFFGQREGIAGSYESGGGAFGEFGPTESFPFRSILVDPEKPVGTTRYWIASASYAEDQRTEPVSIFPHLLSEQLNHSGSPTQVLNAARAGADIQSNLRLLDSLCGQWQPDVVILYEMSTEINVLSELFLSDAGSTEQLRPEEEPKGPSDPVEPNWIVRLAEQTTIYELLRMNLTTKVVEARLLENHFPAEAELEFANRVLGAVQEIRAIGGQPVLCTFATSHDRRLLSSLPIGGMLRWNMYLSAEGWVDAVEVLNQTLRRVAREQDLVLVDVNSAVGGRPELFRDFVHLNRDGHRIVAETIAQTLLTAGVAAPTISTSPAR